MRVQGNRMPDTVTVEPYHPIPGYAEVRVREKIRQIDDRTYEYDEYIIHVRDKVDLRQQVESNLMDWLTTARTLEVNESASLVQDMREALTILGVTTDET